MTEIDKNEAGLARTEPAYLLIGRLQKSHGVKGEIDMRVITQFPERIRAGKTVFLGEEHQEYVIASVRWKNNLLILRLNGFDNPEDASKLTNLEVFTKSRNLPKLPDGQYYHHQLIGLKVWEDQELLGELVEIMETGANDVYVIQAEDGTDLLIPAIPQVIKEIDTVAGTMKVELLEGLRD